MTGGRRAKIITNTSILKDIVKVALVEGVKGGRGGGRGGSAHIDGERHDAHLSSASDTTQVNSLVGERIFIERPKQNAGIDFSLMRNFDVEDET